MHRTSLTSDSHASISHTERVVERAEQMDRNGSRDKGPFTFQPPPGFIGENNQAAHQRVQKELAITRQMPPRGTALGKVRIRHFGTSVILITEQTPARCMR